MLETEKDKNKNHFIKYNYYNENTDLKVSLNELICRYRKRRTTR